MRLVTIVLVATAILFSAVTVTVWRHREAPAATLFTVITAVAGSGVLGVAVSVVLNLGRPAVLVTALLVSLVLPVPWLLFSFRYTGRTELVSFNTAAVVATVPWIGVLATALVFGSQLLPWLALPSRETASGLATLVVALLSLVQWFSLLYAGGLMLIGSGLLLWTFQRYEYLDSTTGMLLGIFGTVPWLSLLFGFQVASIEPLALPRTVAVGFLIGAVSVVSIFSRYHLFRNVPAAGTVGPTTIIEELDDLVILTDEGGTVIEVNETAERNLNASEAEVVGADVSELLDVTLGDQRETRTIEVETGSGRTLLDPSVSELTDQHGRCLGYAIVLRDVTTRTTRQQRLEVLNRVMRHNLSNDLTTIVGQADWLRAKASDPEFVTTAETIVEVADDLAGLSADAAEIAELIDTSKTKTRAVPLGPLVEDVLQTVAGDDPNVACDCEVPSGIEVESSQDLLELALTNLVENAVVHNDTDEPYVAVTARYEPDRPYPLRISVADNGPGIPDMERQVIVRGTESPLHHGTGLGLWAVRWAVTKLGGTIQFDSREPRGTNVSLRFPRTRLSDSGGDGEHDR